jgi:hypothetical protein
MPRKSEPDEPFPIEQAGSLFEKLDSVAVVLD